MARRSATSPTRPICSGHPEPQEAEEFLHPGRSRGRTGGRRIIADVAAGMENIERVREPHTETGFDFGTVPGLQESEERPESHHVSAAGYRPDATRDQSRHGAVNVFGHQLPGRFPRQCQEPLKLPGAAVNGELAESPRNLACNEAVEADSLIDPRINALDRQE